MRSAGAAKQTSDFASSVELQRGTFLIIGGAVYRDGTLQTPNRENSYYYLAETETHARVMLPEGIPSLLGGSVRLSQSRRALFGGGFADLQLSEPRHGYTLFDDNGWLLNGVAAPRHLRGDNGKRSSENQALVAGGAATCSNCDGGLATLGRRQSLLRRRTTNASSPSWFSRLLCRDHDTIDQRAVLPVLASDEMPEGDDEMPDGDDDMPIGAMSPIVHLKQRRCPRAKKRTCAGYGKPKSRGCASNA